VSPREGRDPLESNWKRSVGWSQATTAVGQPGFRVHDLRHTAASVWLAAGADPNVVQWVLGQATAAMTMDLYGHMIDANLWQAAQLVGDISGTSDPPEGRIRTDSSPGEASKTLRSWAFAAEPPWGAALGVQPQDIPDGSLKTWRTACLAFPVWWLG
jgi:hypothetical protein